MDKRMKIGLFANVWDSRVGIGANYVTFFSQFGEVVLVTTDSNLDHVIDTCAVLALPGGADVDPERYGERPHPRTGRADSQLEWLDEHLLKPWLLTGKPVIGICRGLQTLNVACGGTLWQDLTNHVGGEDRTELGHKLYTTVKGWEIIDVNSYHHQGIKKLAPGFEAIGWSQLFKYCPTSRTNEFYEHKFVKNKDNGKVLQSKDTYSMLAEVIKDKDRHLVAFQYHPEDFNCPFAYKMCVETIKECYPEFEPVQNINYFALGDAGGVYKEYKNYL